MAEHVLKTVERYWDGLAAGEKTFEVRRNDRGFQIGDILVLLRGTDAAESGRFVRKRVAYILEGGQFGIEPGYVVLGLADV
jgi:hypothetical protein